MQLTARQQQILDYIRDYVAEHGYPPTFREIGAAHAIKSPNGVMVHIVALEKKKAIKIRHGVARAIAVLGASEADRLRERDAALELENEELRQRIEGMR